MCLHGGHHSAEKKSPTYLRPARCSIVAASVRLVSSRSLSVYPHFWTNELPIMDSILVLSTSSGLTTGISACDELPAALLTSSTI